MPGIRFPDLCELLVSHLESAGATVNELSPAQQRPYRFHVAFDDQVRMVHAYLWTVTSGGKNRSLKERRIQITGVHKFPLLPNVRTIVGGWSTEHGVFAFWDARLHSRFSDKSPSLQISETTLERAYHYGISAESRSVRAGTETAIALQPDYLRWYLDQYETLYDCGSELEAAPDLVDAKPEDEREFIDSGKSRSEQARRHRVVSVLQAFRDARFRPQVLRAYSYRCCISNVALRLVDAAHIIPVYHAGSSDEVWNGLALSPLYHRAYDAGLLGIAPDRRIIWNQRLITNLRSTSLDAGLAELQARTPASIRLPNSPDLHPAPDALRVGLTCRGWGPDEAR